MYATCYRNSIPSSAIIEESYISSEVLLNEYQAREYIKQYTKALRSAFKYETDSNAYRTLFNSVAHIVQNLDSCGHWRWHCDGLGRCYSKKVIDGFVLDATLEYVVNRARHIVYEYCDDMDSIHRVIDYVKEEYINFINSDAGIDFEKIAEYVDDLDYMIRNYIQ
jgi:hypothetical protein